jgi:hypothetical protein
MSKGLFHGQGTYSQPKDGSEYTGNWVRNEMRGQGIKKIRWGEIQLEGYFNGQHINGKGVKKWRTFNVKEIKGTTKSRETKVPEYFIYKGDLEQSQINGYGEFKWPDGRHYIGQFINS